jgi:hypothetical protein
MQIFRHCLPILSVVCGVLIILSGITAFFFYVATFIDAIQQPDKSPIFRYLPFVITGAVLLVTGFWYVAAGTKAFNDDYFYKLVKTSLVILAAIGVILFFVFF